MGCGRTGSRLADMLASAQHDVAVVDWDVRAFTRLSDDFPGTVVHGNAMDQDSLRRAGIEAADVFVAATSGDNRNVMASQVAQQVFHVPRVISRIKDPIRADIYNQLGIRVDCRTTAGAEAVLELIGEDGGA